MTNDSNSEQAHRAADSERRPVNSPVRVALLDDEEEAWDAFASTQSGWTHFHRIGWKRVLERSFGHRCPYMVARDDSGAVVGILPLVVVSSPIFGRYLVSMPFLNYGGPIGDEVAVRALADAATVEAHRRRSKLLELRSAIPLPIDWPVSHRKVTVILDLPDSADALWKQIDAKVRSQVRRPQKEGVQVKIGPDHLGDFYAVFSHHMRDLGTPTLSLRFFDEIAREFGDSMTLAVAYLGDLPIACGMGFRWGEEFEITWASALVSHKRMSANMLVYWELMSHSVRVGVRRFNFGRCTPDSGTHKFKLQWGGHDVPLYWYQHAKHGEAKTPSPDDSAFAWGPRIWKRLPLRVATAIGPHVVKYIP